MPCYTCMNPFKVYLCLVPVSKKEESILEPIIEPESKAEPTPADEILAQSIRISINGDSFEVFCQNLSSVTLK